MFNNVYFSIQLGGVKSINTHLRFKSYERWMQISKINLFEFNQNVSGA